VKKIALCFLLLALLLTGAAEAHSYILGAIKIGHIWTRTTPAGATTAAIYAPFLNTGAVTDHLVSATSPWAQAVQIHTVLTSDTGMKMMQKQDELELPPNQPVALRPGGAHLMAIGLRQPLQAGDKMPLTLTFETAGSITVDVMVEAAGAMAAPPANN